VPDRLPPVLLATAIEAVIRAGAIQMMRAGGDLHIGKKGTIDLVTEVDLEVERGFRALVAGRFPEHVVLGEEFERAGDRDEMPHYGWVFDPVDGTTNYAHGLPIFCSSLALEIDGTPSVAAVYDPTRRELFTAERGQGAWLNGVPLRVSSASALIDSLLCTGFPYSVQQDSATLVGLFGRFLEISRAVRRLGSAAPAPHLRVLRPARMGGATPAAPGPGVRVPGREGQDPGLCQGERCLGARHNDPGETPGGGHLQERG